MSSPPPPRFALADFLPYLAAVLASRMSAALATVYAERFRISVAEWRVIAHLASADNVSVRDIYVRAEMDKSKVSRAAARLERSGMVEKRVNPGDRRLVELSLTDKGRLLFEQIEPLALRYERDLMAVLTPAERTILKPVFRKLLAAAGAAGSDTLP